MQNDLDDSIEQILTNEEQYEQKKLNPKKKTNANAASNGKAKANTNNILDNIYAAPFENNGIALGTGAANPSTIGEYDEEHLKHLGLAVVEDMNQRFVQVLDGDTQTDW